MSQSERIVFGSALVVAALLVAGCAEVPQQEIDAAQAAISEAETAKAPVYAAAEWTEAQEAMAAARTEIEAQNEKFALTRSYEAAQQKLAEASEKAARAREAAAAAKIQAQSDAQAALASMQESVGQAQVLLAELETCGRSPKGFDVDLASLKGSLDGLSAQLPEVEQAITSEDFAGAATRAGAARDQAGLLVTDLASAKSKLRC